MTNYSGKDIYCDLIIPGKVKLNIIKETDSVLAYYHTNPHWPTHIIVTPKRHILDFIELSHDASGIARELFDTVAEIARDVQEKEGGCTIFTTTGDNQNSKHLHIHIRNGDEIS